MSKIKTFWKNHSANIIFIGGCVLAVCTGVAVGTVISKKQSKKTFDFFDTGEKLTIEEAEKFIAGLADYGRLSLILCEQAVRSGKEEVEKIDWFGNGKTFVSLKAVVE